MFSLIGKQRERLQLRTNATNAVSLRDKIQRIMTKWLFSLLVLLLAGTSFAQVSSSERGRTPNPRITPKKTNAAVTQVQNKSMIWSSTFSNLQDWFIGNSANNAANWSISYAPSFWWSGNATLSSTSGGSAAYFDSDSHATAANQIENNAWIQSVPFNCSNNNTVEVSFQQFFNKWTGRTFIQVSNNAGQTWVDYEVNAAMQNNDETPNPELIQVDISPTAANQQFVLIRFLYLSNAISDGGTDNTAGDAWDYGWIIDDVVVAELPDNDIALVEAWHADIGTGYEYSMVPMSQTREMEPTVVIENQGGQSQSFVVNATISYNGNVVDQSSETVSLGYGASDTVVISTGFVPSDYGQYDISFSIPFDQDTSNNTISASPLEVTQNLMAHDYESADAFGWDPNSSDPDVVEFANLPHSWGNAFIPENNEDLYGVDVRFAVGTSPGLNVLVRVQRFNPTSGIQSNLQFVAEQIYTVSASDIGTSVTTIPLPQPALLYAGAGYIIDVYKVDATTGEGFILGGSDGRTEDDDYSSVGFGTYGSGGAINYYSNWGFAPHIRANFNEVLNAEETSFFGFSVYPNPTEGVFTIENQESIPSLISISNLEGRKIVNLETSSSETVDLSDNASGIYLVTLSNSKGSFTKRITLK